MEILGRCRRASQEPTRQVMRMPPASEGAVQASPRPRDATVCDLLYVGRFV